ncbi:MAG: hypothetical protein LBS61_04230 [Endomicrobium sp.]|nr:hypothetical protein [Endomicrobium sp.]
MDNGRFLEAVNELLPIAQGLNFGYSEVNYALGNAFMLNKDYANAAKIFEITVQNKQMSIPQAYANLILAMHFSNNEEKANYYFDEFMKSAHLDQKSANAYLNNFNNFINAQREDDLSRPKTI